MSAYLRKVVKIRICPNTRYAHDVKENSLSAKLIFKQDGVYPNENEIWEAVIVENQFKLLILTKNDK